MKPIEQARRIAAVAQDKLARDVVILDMRPVCAYTDFFVVCAGGNPRQAKAIWDEVHGRLKQENGLLPRSVEGATEATWIIGDYVDVVVHVFTPEAREYYRLEDLWDDVPHEIARSCRGLARRDPGYTSSAPGPIAQLGERLAGSQKVAGSSPAGSIIISASVQQFLRSAAYGALREPRPQSVRQRGLRRASSPPRSVRDRLTRVAMAVEMERDCPRMSCSTSS